MRFVSPALKHVVFPVLSRSGYLRYASGPGPAIVTYHGVFPPGYKVQNRLLDGNLVRADSLRCQLSLLKNRYHVISPDEFLCWIETGASLPPRSFLLTCDDALRNSLTEMVPILKELGLRCLFFATGASLEPSPSMLWYEELYLMLLDAAPPFSVDIPEAEVRFTATSREVTHSCWWRLVELLSALDAESRRGSLNQILMQLRLPVNWRDKYIRDPLLASRFLTLDLAGLRQLAAAGMTIGAHSLSHPVLARTSHELAWMEIAESGKRLEQALGQKVWAFGYPFGNAATVTQREIQLAQQAGYRCAFMNSGGGFGARLDRFAAPRVHVTAEMSLSEFEAHMSGLYRSLRGLFGGEAAIGA